MEFFGKPESWVLVAFILFVALMVYLKVPAMVAKMLDERSAKIAKDLDEARKLREEAQALLDSYKSKRSEAEQQAAGIVAQAKADAEEYAEEARKKLPSRSNAAPSRPNRRSPRLKLRRSRTCAMPQSSWPSPPPPNSAPKPPRAARERR